MKTLVVPPTAVVALAALPLIKKYAQSTTSLIASAVKLSTKV